MELGRFIAAFVTARTGNPPKSVLSNTYAYNIHTLHNAAIPNPIHLQLSDGGITKEFLLV